MKHVVNTFFNTIPRLGAKLSSGGIFGVATTTFYLWWFTVSRKLIKNLPDYPIQLWYLDQSFILYLRYPMDIGVLREIYIDGEYRWCPVANPNVIIDLGAHYGDTALYYHLRFPHAKIIAVEPSPENYDRLVKNVGQIPNIITVRAAVGNTNGTIDLHIGRSALGYSTVGTDEANATVLVPQVTLQQLLMQNEIKKADLVKFDIEGAEFSVFANAESVECSESFIGEVHTDLVPDSTLDAFVDCFKGLKCESTQIAGRGRYLVRIQK